MSAAPATFRLGFKATGIHKFFFRPRAWCRGPARTAGSSRDEVLSPFARLVFRRGHGLAGETRISRALTRRRHPVACAEPCAGRGDRCGPGLPSDPTNATGGPGPDPRPRTSRVVRHPAARCHARRIDAGRPAHAACRARPRTSSWAGPYLSEPIERLRPNRPKQARRSMASHFRTREANLRPFVARGCARTPVKLVDRFKRANSLSTKSPAFGVVESVWAARPLRRVRPGAVFHAIGFAPNCRRTDCSNGFAVNAAIGRRTQFWSSPHDPRRKQSTMLVRVP